MSKEQSKNHFYSDEQFYKSSNARSIRILSEYLGPKQRFQRNHIEDTIVFFGSARILSKEKAKKNIEKASKKISMQEKNRLHHDELMSTFYDDARSLAQKLTHWSKKQKNSKHRYIITSGGGPGIMEAASRGASEAKGLSIGLNITIPHEQSGNKWLTPDLNMEFHYFFMRKFWFIYKTKGIVVMPGGFGTLDELFDILTLLQCKKITRKIPIILIGSEYWDGLINWDRMIKHKTISRSDLKLFVTLDSVDKTFDYLVKNMQK